MRSLGLLVLIATSVAAPACALYGDKPEHLRNPEKKKKPPEAIAAEQPIKYIEDCAAEFHSDPKAIKPQVSVGAGLAADGDTILQSAEKTGDVQARGNLLKDAIAKYSNALRKDPYNAEATLNLARAYDMVLRKGCAIALLKRLGSLSSFPRFQHDANLKIDSIDDNTGWFKGYRKDAIAAVGK
jgi:hypothetical protein